MTVYESKNGDTQESDIDRQHKSFPYEPNIEINGKHVDADKQQF